MRGLQRNRCPEDGAGLAGWLARQKGKALWSSGIAALALITGFDFAWRPATPMAP